MNTPYINKTIVVVLCVTLLINSLPPDAIALRPQAYKTMIIQRCSSSGLPEVTRRQFLTGLVGSLLATYYDSVDASQHTVSSEVEAYLINAIKKDYFVYILYCRDRDGTDFDKIKPALDAVFEAAKKEKKTLLIYTEGDISFPPELIQRGLKGRDPVKGVFIDKNYEEDVLDYIQQEIENSAHVFSNQWWKKQGSDYLIRLKKQTQDPFLAALQLYFFDKANKDDFNFIEVPETLSIDSCLKTLDTDILDELIQTKENASELWDVYKKYVSQRDITNITRDNILLASITELFNSTPSMPTVPIVVIRGAGHKELEKKLCSKGYNIASFISKEHKEGIEKLEKMRMDSEELLEELKEAARKLEMATKSLKKFMLFKLVIDLVLIIIVPLTIGMFIKLYRDIQKQRQKEKVENQPNTALPKETLAAKGDTENLDSQPLDNTKVSAGSELDPLSEALRRPDNINPVEEMIAPTQVGLLIPGPVEVGLKLKDFQSAA